MFEVKVLTTKDRDAWRKLLDNAEFSDVNWLPEYLQLFEEETSPAAYRSFGGTGILFVYGDGENFVLYPFFKRSLSVLPFANENVKGLSDIISPYGYGGPVARLKDADVTERLWLGFFQKLDDFCVQNRIVSEFCRLHPLLHNHGPLARFSGGLVERLGQVCYVDLTPPVETILKNMIHGHRRRITRAQENGDLVFSCQKHSGSAKEFFGLYQATMVRRQASDRYFFSEGFFEKCFEYLGDALSYCHVHYKGENISSWLVTCNGEFAYAWLSGASPEHFSLFPTNLLVYETILKLKREGARTLILGGGKSVSKDTIFRFKYGFCQRVEDYFVYKRIHLPEEYSRLVVLQSSPTSEQDGYFPAYRSYEEKTPSSDKESANVVGNDD